MRIVVTGHRGYLGSVLVPRLLAAGHQLRGLDAGWFEGCDFGPEPVGIDDFSLDIRAAQPRDFEGADAVVHLAGLSNDPLGNLDPKLTFAINHGAALTVARAARRAGVRRFIHASSCSQYGAASPEEVLDEQAPLRPVTAYGESKLQVEADLAGLTSERFVPTYLRMATVYGVSPRLRGDLVVNNLVAHALTSGRVLLKSDGTPWRPLVHVEDVAAAFLAVLEAPEAAVRDRAFNVGRTGENYRISEVAERVRAAIPSAYIEYAEGAGPDVRCYRVSCARIESELPGFRPQWQLDRGIAELRDAMLAFGMTTEALERGRYSRIHHIRGLLADQRMDPSLRWQVAASGVGS